MREYGPFTFVRFAALLIDVVVCMVAVVLGLYVVDPNHDFQFAVALLGPVSSDMVLPFGVYLAYAIILPLRPGHEHGQTIGKQLMLLRITTDSGEPVGLQNLVWREASRVFAACLFVPLLIIDAIAGIWGDRYASIHDRLGGTVVERVPVERTSPARA